MVIQNFRSQVSWSTSFDRQNLRSKLFVRRFVKSSVRTKRIAKGPETFALIVYQSNTNNMLKNIVEFRLETSKFERFKWSFERHHFVGNLTWMTNKNSSSYFYSGASSMF